MTEAMKRVLEMENMFFEVYKNERTAIDVAAFNARKDMESMNEDGREMRMEKFREELYEISRTHSKLIDDIAKDNGMSLTVDEVREMCKVKFNI